MEVVAKKEIRVIRKIRHNSCKKCPFQLLIRINYIEIEISEIKEKRSPNKLSFRLHLSKSLKLLERYFTIKRFYIRTTTISYTYLTKVISNYGASL